MPAPGPSLDHVPPPENSTNVFMGSQSQTNQCVAPISDSAATTMSTESNNYVSPAPVQSSSSKSNALPITPLASAYAKAATNRKQSTIGRLLVTEESAEDKAIADDVFFFITGTVFILGDV
ncbi:hypothetical protein F3Y22_tig00110945pilonHSYRG00133 [Hibiscus syriacus]|uniref:Uncharacterized protein n=1 Tax=Hibiscus syriacus TaxID=106335 RepID=A0A6A2ZC57_HIBSY|nr:hypothetical protein F3Y22_tig00110945pilonHSYRG00133 [Hibiscus syriacus]